MRIPPLSRAPWVTGHFANGRFFPPRVSKASWGSLKQLKVIFSPLTTLVFLFFSKTPRCRDGSVSDGSLAGLMAIRPESRSFGGCSRRRLFHY